MKAEEAFSGEVGADPSSSMSAAETLLGSSVGARSECDDRSPCTVPKEEEMRKHMAASAAPKKSIALSYTSRAQLCAACFIGARVLGDSSPAQ